MEKTPSPAPTTALVLLLPLIPPPLLLLLLLATRPCATRQCLSMMSEVASSTPSPSSRSSSHVQSSINSLPPVTSTICHCFWRCCSKWVCAGRADSDVASTCLPGLPPSTQRKRDSSTSPPSSLEDVWLGASPSVDMQCVAAPSPTSVDMHRVGVTPTRSPVPHNLTAFATSSGEAALLDASTRAVPWGASPKLPSPATPPTRVAAVGTIKTAELYWPGDDCELDNMCASSHLDASLLPALPAEHGTEDGRDDGDDTEEARECMGCLVCPPRREVQSAVNVRSSLNSAACSCTSVAHALASQLLPCPLTPFTHTADTHARAYARTRARAHLHARTGTQVRTMKGMH